MKLSPAVISAFATAFNRYLQLDPEAAARMAGLQGHCIALELRGLDLTLYLVPQADGVRLLQDSDCEPDTVLSGTPLGMASLGLGGNTEQTLFSGEVSISGDVETGQAFKAILDTLDIDWEEQLSRLTGDVVAHQLGNAARSVHRFLAHTRRTLEQDSGEYLQQELRVLPSRIETENFMAGVTRLAMDTDRLAARIKRLQATDGTSDA
jgi:ubiquinone biosynthesis protein UbiJ